MIIYMTGTVGVDTEDSPSRVTQELLRNGSCEVFATRIFEDRAVVAENTPAIIFAHAVTFIMKDSPGE